MISVRRRLIVSSALLLTAFLGLAGFILDSAFRDAGREAVEALLRVQLLSILGEASEGTETRIVVPDELSEAKFQNPGSGLYAEIVDSEGNRIWRSESLLGTLDFGGWLDPGETYTRQLIGPGAQKLLAYSMGIEWVFNSGELRRFRISVAQDLAAYHAQVASFRRKLLTWFAGLGVVLLLAQLWVLRLGLSPLRQVEAEIAEIEAGVRNKLGRNYPRELAGVTGNLNALIDSERRRLQRYRDTLDNLAHSLKTPLAAGTSLLEGAGAPDRDKLARQLARMKEIVEFQLRRASASGASGLGQDPVLIEPSVREVSEALEKVYLHKGVEIDSSVAKGARFFGTRDDLLEILGNLMDNACKWAVQRVSVKVSTNEDNPRPGLNITIDDDGPGIPVAHREDVLGKGVRGDELKPGQGIGLSVVREIIELYGGHLIIGDSALGGARIAVSFSSKTRI